MLKRHLPMFAPFELEQYLLKHEPRMRVSLCASGLETCSLSELLSSMDTESEALWTETSLDYTHPQGSVPLRESIAQQYEALTAQHVGVFAGAAEAILCTLQGLLTPEDHAVVVTPCYQSLFSIPASLCQVSTVSLREATGWQLEPDRVQSALKPNTRAIIINFPNNPTGALPSLAVLSELVDMARQRGIYLFSDEVYRLMEIDPADRLPPVATLYERGISVSSLSKAYGLPGLRIGWVASQAPEVLSGAIDVKHYTSICVTSPGEVLATLALGQGDAILARNLQQMRANLSVMDQFFERMSDHCRWVRPRGGCLGFPRYLRAETTDALCQSLLEETGVMILPGSLYGPYASHFRIGFGRKDCQAALTQLEHFLSRP
ncbi:aminotransferase class I/II-fold pyridoxal phosphate-dependent enzyme [Vampirovibrio chlorellavorus]|uniref:aminotransferase class I/II-fold pyridoxal phosphate-dependent enzyme n=1 Tax=Vampirovibrio chlorellavorus TaxID=758823 RepID=UPI0026F03E4F|nr:aminotransferase class I/II-fold pyridoxal phosphate-dependent enzyme [Vampirovibrio chlorellavorus]